MKKVFLMVIALSVAAAGYAQVLKSPTSSISKSAKKVVVYEEGKGGTFAPSGWMGDTSALKIDPNCTTKPKDGKFCMKWTYDISKGGQNGWAGAYWQYPANNWGTLKGFDLTGHKKLSFWVRGETGKEVVDFTAGGIKGKIADTFIKEMKEVKLSSEWKQYTIDLSGKDLSNVSGGFCWTADSKKNAGNVTLYLDDIIYE